MVENSIKQRFNNTIVNTYNIFSKYPAKLFLKFLSYYTFVFIWIRMETFLAHCDLCGLVM